MHSTRLICHILNISNYVASFVFDFVVNGFVASKKPTKIGDNIAQLAARRKNSKCNFLATVFNFYIGFPRAWKRACIKFPECSNQCFLTIYNLHLIGAPPTAFFPAFSVLCTWCYYWQDWEPDRKEQAPNSKYDDEISMANTISFIHSDIQ